ncbi:MAG: hypothetical protein AAF203_11400, partial [Pseudomonadota bacterium]
GYHGRASSIMPSGVNIKRPKGQIKTPEASEPTFGPKNHSLLDQKRPETPARKGINRISQ